MATNVSLRKSLRQIPDFRSLSVWQLETLLGQMICKEYQPGEVIWRTRGQINYLVLVRKGEILLEHRIYGSVARSKRLIAGDYVLPRNLKLRNPHSIVLARAVTHVRLSVLPMERVNSKPIKLSQGKMGLSISPFFRHLLWDSFWLAIVVSLILFFTWTDLTRIASGLLYVFSANADQPASNEQTSMRLLAYAEAIDHRADFAYNREGYIWFHHDNLRQAEAAFMKALSVDRANGPALNNQAVTYFTTGQILQAEIYQQEAARHAPDSAIVKYNLGLVLMKDNDNLEAIREFREASFINPTWVLPYLQQGFLYNQLGDYVNAEKAARAAIRLDPSQGSAHLILGIALHGQSLDQDALTAVEEALQITPEDRVARFYQARILKNLGDFDEAVTILKHLLNSTDDPQEVSRIDAEIESWQRDRQTVPSGVP